MPAAPEKRLCSGGGRGTELSRQDRSGSKETAELIANALSVVEKGKALADETAASFRLVTQGVTLASDSAQVIS